MSFGVKLKTNRGDILTTISCANVLRKSVPDLEQAIPHTHFY